MKNFLTTLAGVTAILSLMSGGVRAATIPLQLIDDFLGEQSIEVPQNPDDPTPIPFQAPEIVTFNSSILGNNVQRSIGGVLTSNPNRGGVQNQVFQSIYSDANYSGAKSTSYINYAGGKLGGSVGANFLLDRADRLVFDVQRNDNIAQIMVTVTDLDGTTGIGKIPTTDQDLVLLDMLYSDFKASGGNGTINFDNITQFKIDIDATLNSSTELRFESVSTGRSSEVVPESSSGLGLLVFGGLGVILSLTKKFS